MKHSGEERVRQSEKCLVGSFRRFRDMRAGRTRGVRRDFRSFGCHGDRTCISVQMNMNNEGVGEMSPSGKSCNGAIRRGLYPALCSAALLVLMQGQTQAQSVLTHHVRRAGQQRSGAVPERAARYAEPCASTLFCRCAIRQGWINFCRRSTILPAPPTAISLRCRSLPRGLVPARKIMTPWLATLHRTAFRWLAVPAMEWICRSRARWRRSRRLSM